MISVHTWKRRANYHIFSPQPHVPRILRKIHLGSVRTGETSKYPSPLIPPQLLAWSCSAYRLAKGCLPSLGRPTLSPTCPSNLPGLRTGVPPVYRPSPLTPRPPRIKVWRHRRLRQHIFARCGTQRDSLSFTVNQSTGPTNLSRPTSPSPAEGFLFPLPNASS
jgi:hypothetical protein